MDGCFMVEKAGLIAAQAVVAKEFFSVPARRESYGIWQYSQLTGLGESSAKLIRLR